LCKNRAKTAAIGYYPARLLPRVAKQT